MKTRYVGGDCIEITGGNNKVFANSIVTNAEKISYNAPQHTYGDPADPKPFETPDFYIKVRIKEPKEPKKPEDKIYNGKFGFDWIDLNPDTGRVEKIQDVPFENVEYFYKEGQNGDLGNIVKKSDDVSGAQTAIEKHYKYNSYSKYVDYPYVLIKPDQDEIILEIQIIPYRGELKEDYLSITGDEFYDFTIDGGTKEGKISKIKVTGETKLDFKIKCLKESPEKTYDFKHNNTVLPEWIIGGLVMMENKVMNLKFRVIALVSNEGSASTKAKALFAKFKNNGVAKYLNENSLNQAGYKVEIENEYMFTNLDNPDLNLDDYFYAFDKEDWIRKKYFGNVIKQKQDVDPETGYCRKESWDSEKKECKKVPVPTDVIVDDQKDLGLPEKSNEMDGITISAYKDKLKAKDKSYEGGIIILADFESSDENTGAYSRMDPLNHYALMMYSNNTGSKDTYSHEIGHMLGLPHLFYKSKEKEAYRIAREDILGNNEPEKNSDGTKNDKYKAGINKEISIAKNKNTYYDMSNTFYSDKKSLTTYLNNFINYYQGKLKTANYTDSAKKNINGEIAKNQKALEELKTVTDCGYKNYYIKCYFLKDDYVKYLERRKQYLEDILQQMNMTILFYKQKTTRNIMDYYNSRLYYNHKQIKIMRNDSKNFLPEFCQCKPSTKKK